MMKAAVVSLAIVAAILVALLFSAPVQAARTIVWDSTSEWDSGITSSYDGHYALETESKNEAVRPDILHAGMLRGDEFHATGDTGATPIGDPDGQTWKMRPPPSIDCTDNGDEYIPQNIAVTFAYTSPSSGLGVSEVIVTGGLLPVNDRSLVFHHNSTGYQNKTSTRGTANFTAVYGGWMADLSFRRSFWGVGNFTWAMTTANSTNPQGRLFCGGYNATATGVDGGGFYLRKAVATDIGPGLWRLQAFTLSNGVMTNCGGVIFPGDNFFNLRILTSGQRWSFGTRGPPGGSLFGLVMGQCNVFGDARVYTTFDFNTSHEVNNPNAIGGLVAIQDYRVQADYFTNPDWSWPSAYRPSVDANWTSPSTGGLAAERISRIVFRAYKEHSPSGEDISFCTPSVLSATDWTVYYTAGVCTAFGTDGYQEWTLTPTGLPDGPYRVRLFFAGMSDSAAYIVSITVDLIGQPLPPPSEGPGPPTLLAPAIATGLCGIIALMVVLSFIVLLRRLKPG